jgi:hypothetical protein
VRETARDDGSSETIRARARALTIAAPCEQRKDERRSIHKGALNAHLSASGGYTNELGKFDSARVDRRTEKVKRSARLVDRGVTNANSFVNAALTTFREGTIRRTTDCRENIQLTL